MTSGNTSDKVGVIGAGSFGTAIANILAQKTKVLLYARKPEMVDTIARTRMSSGQRLHDNIQPIHDLEQMAGECEIIFPIVPSENFREMIRKLSPYLRPYHMLIHGTKGLLVRDEKWFDKGGHITPEDICTMSKVIRAETVVVRIGCLAGPNLAKELADNQPAATVVASRFDEVIRNGERLLRNERFQVTVTVKYMALNFAVSSRM